MKIIRVIMIVAVIGFLPLSCNNKEGLTESEVVQGLKEALKVGTETAVGIVSKPDGYYKDAVIKILLPPECDVVYDAIKKQPQLFEAIGLSQLLENIILGINRAAEDAATKAIPIFVNAVVNLSIQDGMSILKGADNAATVYLKNNTYPQLKQLFQPPMDSSLSKPLIGNESPKTVFKKSTEQYNIIVNNASFLYPELKPVQNTDLPAFVTEKGLNGLFNKLENEEKEIRKNPAKRINDILKKVFGSLD